MASARSTRLAVAAFLFACVGGALLLRSCLVYDRVFLDTHVNFHEADPWYHVRAVEHLTQRFPDRLVRDPYALHPGGAHVPVGPLFDWMVAGVVLLLSGGSPTTEFTHRVCAWFPAVLGALIPLPVYFLGRRLLDVRCGLFAAALIAILPGPFLQRSLLGFTDHHVAEGFFSLLVVVFLAGALGRAADGPSPAGARPRQMPHERPPAEWTPMIRSALAGGCLGAYLLSWVGGPLFVLALCACGWCILVSDALRSRPAVRSPLCFAVVMAAALLLVLPYRSVSPYPLHVAALVPACLFFAAMAAGAAMALRARRPRVVLLAALAVAAAAGFGGLRAASPDIWSQAMSELRRFAGGAAGGFVNEAVPLLFDQGELSLAPAYGMFVTALVTFAIGLALVLYRALWYGRAVDWLVGAWSIFWLAAAFQQQRFAYYLAINAAILSGYVWSRLIGRIPPLRRSAPASGIVLYAAGVIGFLAIGVYPCLSRALATAGLHNGPHTDWHRAMTWLRENSPEPFDSPDAYFQSYDGPPGRPAAEGAPGPDGLRDHPAPLPADDPPGYGVMCWWDHGYWITQMAHRPACANPTQAGAAEAAAFLTAQDEASAARILRERDARYVVLEATLPVWFEENTDRLIGKFGTVIRWAGQSELAFYEPYLVPTGAGKYQVRLLYYPAFYRSMLARLYLYGGRAYTPADGVWAVRFSEVPHKGGGRLKQIERTEQFETYEEAEQFVAGDPDRWRIVGLHFGQSCVPLERLERFEPVYKSPTTVAEAAGRSISHVEIFRFQNPTPPSAHPIPHGVGE